MDFDSIVSILIIIAFFILPSILKQIKASKIRKQEKSPQASAVSKQKTSVFGKIGEQINKFIHELEQQSQQQRQAQSAEDRAWKDQSEKVQAGTDQANIWDLLGQDEGFYEDATQSDTLVSDKHLNLEKADPPDERIESEKPKFKTKVQPMEPPYMTPTVPSQSFVFKSNQLQNAIVLSEILSKPVALRKD